MIQSSVGYQDMITVHDSLRVDSPYNSVGIACCKFSRRGDVNFGFTNT